MSISSAREEYDRLYSLKTTPEEFEAGLNDLIKNHETGRASGFYRPAYDPLEEDDPLWP